MSEWRSLSDVLRRVATGNLLKRSPDTSDDAATLAVLCRGLVNDQGEASGLVTAQRILDGLNRLNLADKAVLFTEIAESFGPDEETLAEAVADWTPNDIDAARRLHFAAEPRTQALIRALNRVPGATARLVALRAELLSQLKNSPPLAGLDEDFRHLFSSWFNRGFLEIRRIDWTTPADVLEKIIAYEAVHEIKGWEDLRRRVGDPDRRLFGFFHPAMPSEPLIFVEVALTPAIPGAIGPILEDARERLDPAQATTATFYSISNCQKGLRGISFGNFLIKQVVTELQRELPGLKTFVTLSPVPGFRRWAERALEDEASPLRVRDRETLIALREGSPVESKAIAALAARYLLRAKRQHGTAADPVAHFHLGNGAALHRIHAEADLSNRGRENAWGVMVNYLYEADRIENRHQAYATRNEVAAAPEIRALAEG